MVKSRTFLLIAIVLLIVNGFVYGQSKETGALKGVITLEDGSPVPGVLVSLSSEKVAGANKTTVTNEEGRYRFVGLLPSTYTIKASLEGFASAKQDDIKVSTSKTLTVDLTLKQGKITEEVIVEGKSPVVDVKSSGTATVELPTEFLQNIPNSQFTADAVNLAPGVTRDVAYGAASGTGIAYQIDGVDVSDPSSGTAWVFLDYHVVEEVSVSGIGAAAEYGGFTGVVFNTITKSGGNNFKGFVELLYQGKSWNSTNSDDPDFAPGSVTFYSGHIDVGGPIIKDKLTFFASFLYHREIEGISGTDYDIDYWQPKGFLKFSWNPTQKTRFQIFGEFDLYNGVGRDGNANTAQEATVNQDSPEAVGNISMTHLFSDYTFMEAKVAYFTGYYSLDPYAGDNVYGHIDFATGENFTNAVYFYRGDRSRLQANASVTHHADDFMGNHDFKFGAEVIQVTQRDQYGYSNGGFYGDWYGEPYLFYDYEGYDIEGKLTTISFFAQDSWSVTDRLTINPGIRVDTARGGVKDIPGNQYKVKPAIAPRIGLTYDVLGDHSTAVKAHWGRYYESAYVSTFRRLSSAISDYNIYWHDGAEFLLDLHIPGGTSQYTIDPDLKQQYMDQWTVGVERELVKDLSLGVTYINRRNYNQIAPVDIGGQYVQGTYTDDITGQTYAVWDQVNSRADSIFYITNPEVGDYSVIEFTPYRKYSGIEILLNKRFSNKWQLMASYVYSKARGNFNNTSSTGAGRNSTFTKPNYQINSDGKLTTDPTHMLKIQGTVVLPLDINFNVNFQLITGNNYTMDRRLPRSVDSNRTYIFLEQRGANRYPTSKNLDLRLEKTFKFGDMKLGILVDIFNVFNQGIVTSYETVATNFEDVLRIVPPRAFRAGLRLWF
jgi:outer membrane receptor protein involved in Fe transport